ncbi:uncharacterized protein LOC128723941 [Anopheles nili]|uniref:uncharacterized protein LOC128723941 n=1 Tax=Anopheles nili TaxID=185578 RepID=UPI00237B0B3A|nr:uncharacterized protein LOC128723941 [Anopheles nili]
MAKITLSISVQLQALLYIAALAIILPSLSVTTASDLESFAATEALAHHHHDDLVHHHPEALLHSLAATDHSLLHHDLHHHDLHHDLHHDVHHHDVHHVHHDVHHDHVVVSAAPQPTGFWKKKLVWKPRWVKSWQEKKVYVGVWKRVWGPVQVNEWVPIPKPPPGWTKHH